MARKRYGKKKTYTKRKPTYRRRYKRNYKRSMPQRTMVNLGMGFPKMVKMVHRYCETVRIVSSGGVPQFHRFRANGMYDPNQTSLGHQPLLFDQQSAIWNHWKVIGSKIHVQFIPTAATTVPQHVGILADDDVVTTTTLDSIKEQPDNRAHSIAFNNSSPRTLRQFFSAKKVYGPSIMGNNRLEGDSANDPTEQYFFTLYTAPLDGSTSCGVDAIVTIDYIAIWTEQKDIPGS